MDAAPVTVAERLEEIRHRIAVAGGDVEAVRIVAVTKGFDAGAVRAAVAAGVVDIGENYAQELVAKADELRTGGTTVSWHFLGRLQRNKVRAVATVLALWQSVDRLELAQEIARRAPGAAVLVQVNISGEAQKGGCEPDDAPALVDAARTAGLDVRGLMAVGPSGTPEDARPGFRALAAMARRLDLPELSMGMSDDLEVAVQEGATIVRIGRALFGPRPPR